VIGSGMWGMGRMCLSIRPDLMLSRRRLAHFQLTSPHQSHLTWLGQSGLDGAWRLLAPQQLMLRCIIGIHRMVVTNQKEIEDIDETVENPIERNMRKEMHAAIGIEEASEVISDDVFRVNVRRTGEGHGHPKKRDRKIHTAWCLSDCVEARS